MPFPQLIQYTETLKWGLRIGLGRNCYNDSAQEPEVLYGRPAPDTQASLDAGAFVFAAAAVHHT